MCYSFSKISRTITLIAIITEHAMIIATAIILIIIIKIVAKKVITKLFIRPPEASLLL